MHRHYTTATITGAAQADLCHAPHCSEPTSQGKKRQKQRIQGWSQGSKNSPTHTHPYSILLHMARIIEEGKPYIRHQ